MQRAALAVHLDPPPRETLRDLYESTVKHLLPAILAELGFQNFNKRKYLLFTVDAGAFWRRHVRKKGIPHSSEKHYALAVEYLDGDRNRGEMFWKPHPHHAFRTGGLEYPRDGQRLRQGMTALFHQFTRLNIDMMRPEPITPFEMQRCITSDSKGDFDDDLPLKQKTARHRSMPVKSESNNVLRHLASLPSLTPQPSNPSLRPTSTPRSASEIPSFFTPRSMVQGKGCSTAQSPSTITSLGRVMTPAMPATPIRNLQRVSKANRTPTRSSKAKSSLRVMKQETTPRHQRTPRSARKMILGQDRQAQRESPSDHLDITYQVTGLRGSSNTMTTSRPRRAVRQTARPDGYMDWQMAEDHAGGEEELSHASPHPHQLTPILSRRLKELMGVRLHSRSVSQAGWDGKMCQVRRTLHMWTMPVPVYFMRLAY